MENYKYLVCVLGYNSEGDPTDTEIYLEEFETPEPALKYAREIQTVEDCLEAADETLDTVYGFHPERGDFLTLRVEQCVEMEAEDDTDPEEGWDECVDVLYECDLVFKEEA